MSNSYTVEVEFVTPDDVGKDNVEHVLGQFLADLERTDRFTVARIVEEKSLDEGEVERLLELLSNVEDADIDSVERALSTLEDESE